MASIKQDVPVVEIGPGLGTLTKQLLNYGHKVYAVEIDPKLFSNLQSELTDFISKDQLNLINKDAVKYPLGNLPITEKDFAVIANLPYAISSPWLESVLNTNRIPKRMVLMLQKEAVERMECHLWNKALQRIKYISQCIIPTNQSSPGTQAVFSSSTRNRLRSR